MSTFRLFTSIIPVSEAVVYMSATSQRSAYTMRIEKLNMLTLIEKYSTDKITIQILI